MTGTEKLRDAMAARIRHSSGLELSRASLAADAILALPEMVALTQLRDRLRQHFLAAIVCDHERGMDNPQCACSRAFLGWHPSVGAAVDAWVEHVLAGDAYDKAVKG